MPERYVRAGKYVTGAGVSASIDTGLFLTQILGGDALARAIQLGIEYYPSPPFAEKSPGELPAATQEIVRAFEGRAHLDITQVEPPFAGSFDVLRSHTSG